MNSITTARRLTVALSLATGVLFLCSARPPLGTHHTRAVTPRVGERTLAVFEKHQLALRDSIVRLALAQVGTKYELGGETPEAFDCSGLIQYVYSSLYLTPPRTAALQARIGAPIRRDMLRPGDILAFGTRDTVTHVGIYVGDRKFVHASSVAGRVVISSVDRAPSALIRPLKTARRVLAMAD